MKGSDSEVINLGDIADYSNENERTIDLNQANMSNNKLKKAQLPGRIGDRSTNKTELIRVENFQDPMTIRKVQ